MTADVDELVRRLNIRAIEADTRRTAYLPVTEIPGIPACGDTITRMEEEQNADDR